VMTKADRAVRAAYEARAAASAPAVDESVAEVVDEPEATAA
jgi:hypothetical protein